LALLMSREAEHCQGVQRAKAVSRFVGQLECELAKRIGPLAVTQISGIPRARAHGPAPQQRGCGIRHWQATLQPLTRFVQPAAQGPMGLQ
jgi:hypothetical protein